MTHLYNRMVTINCSAADSIEYSTRVIKCMMVFPHYLLRVVIITNGPAADDMLILSHVSMSAADSGLTKTMQLKFYYSRYRVLGPELILVYRQSAHR